MVELKRTLTLEGACDCIVLDGLPFGPTYCSGDVTPLTARESRGILGNMRETCRTPTESSPPPHCVITMGVVPFTSPLDTSGGVWVLHM